MPNPVHATPDALIASVHAREILDPNGRPGLEVDVELDDGALGRAAVPAGIWTGGIAGEGFTGFRNGLRNTVHDAFQAIAHELVGLPAAGQSEVDWRLLSLERLGTVRRLGDGAILGVSMAVAQAAAASSRQPLYRNLNAPHGCILPVPMFAVLHGGGFSGPDAIFEKFMIAPVGAPSFRDALHMSVDTHLALKGILRRKRPGTAPGDEDGPAPERRSDVEAMELLLEAIEAAGLRPGADFVLACDAAADRHYGDGTYRFRHGGRERWTAERLVERYEQLCRQYPVWSIENGLADVDIDGLRLLIERLGSSVQLAGGGHPAGAEIAYEADAEAKTANAVLITFARTRTVSEILDRIASEKAARQGIVISDWVHEPCEFIADLSVATAAGQIDTGAPAGADHVAKYNRFLRIEEELGAESRYAGRGFVLWGGFH